MPATALCTRLNCDYGHCKFYRLACSFCLLLFAFSLSLSLLLSSSLCITSKVLKTTNDSGSRGNSTTKIDELSILLWYKIIVCEAVADLASARQNYEERSCFSNYKTLNTLEWCLLVIRKDLMQGYFLSKKWRHKMYKYGQLEDSPRESST